MKKILVIEDNKDIRENLEELLSLSNYKVNTAADGAKGIEYALAAHYDLILCDVAMPVKNGYEVLEVLKSHATKHEIPFIFLTASAQEEDIAMGKASKADAYMTKPFEMEELLATIRQFCIETLE